MPPQRKPRKRTKDPEVRLGRLKKLEGAELLIDEQLSKLREDMLRWAEKDINHGLMAAYMRWAFIRGFTLRVTPKGRKLLKFLREKGYKVN